MSSGLRGSVSKVAEKTGRAALERVRGQRTGPLVGLRGGDEAAEIVIGEREPGEEP